MPPTSTRSHLGDGAAMSVPMPCRTEGALVEKTN